MKRAANVLFLVSAIISIVCAIGYLITGIVCLAGGSNTEILRKALEQLVNEGTIHLPSGVTIDDLLAVYSAYTITIGVFSLIAMACSIANAVIGFKCRNQDKKFMFILSIIFSALSTTVVGIVGGIFALVKGDTIE